VATIGASVPPLSDVCRELGRVLTERDLWLAVGQTLRSTVIGLALCLAVGIGAGVLISAHRYLVVSTRFVIDFCRTVPPLAIVPLFLLVLGPTARMEVLLVFAVGVWPVLVQTIYGVRNVDPELLRTARSFGLPLWRRLVFVVAPAAMPYVAAGVRICATLCLLLAIGSELIAGVPGLGQEILLSQQAGASPRMFALTLVAGALGAAVSVVLTVGEHKLLAWHHRPRAAM
jgi:ABC-type nitrate/sulfonate/bicarbonate transport system permease component